MPTECLNFNNYSDEDQRIEDEKHNNDKVN